MINSLLISAIHSNLNNCMVWYERKYYYLNRNEWLKLKDRVEDVVDPSFLRHTHIYITIGRFHKFRSKTSILQWHEKFDEAVMSNSSTINDVDKCTYSKSDKTYCVMMCLYVDDMLILGSNISCERNKEVISSKFDMKNL